MREAIGGAWLYYIFVVMIMFIVSFLAIFLNYMTAYRANNHLISVLEQSEGIMPAGIEQKLNASFNYSSHFKTCYPDIQETRDLHIARALQHRARQTLHLEEDTAETEDGEIERGIVGDIFCAAQPIGEERTDDDRRQRNHKSPDETANERLAQYPAGRLEIVGADEVCHLN